MELAQLTWPQVDRLPRSLPVIIPVAAVEQHGHHLPLITDSLLLGEIVRRAEQVCGEECLLLPLTWLGNSHHHLDFPGTLSAEPRQWIDMTSGLVDNMLQHGFQRILIINGHGGNDVPSRQALFELRQQQRQRADLLLLSATYWALAEPDGSIPLAQSQMQHACEWETSMVQRIAPQLVGDFAAQPAVSAESGFEPAHRAWITKDRTIDGHIGQPAAATPEKGEHLLQTFSCGLTTLIRKMAAWDGAAWSLEKS